MEHAQRCQDLGSEWMKHDETGRLGPVSQPFSVCPVQFKPQSDRFASSLIFLVISPEVAPYMEVGTVPIIEP